MRVTRSCVCVCVCVSGEQHAEQRRRRAAQSSDEGECDNGGRCEDAHRARGAETHLEECLRVYWLLGLRGALGFLCLLGFLPLLCFLCLLVSCFPPASCLQPFPSLSHRRPYRAPVRSWYQGRCQTSYASLPLTAPGWAASVVARAELMLLVGAWLLSSGLLLLVECAVLLQVWLATALVGLAELLQVQLPVLFLPTRSTPATHMVSASGTTEVVGERSSLGRGRRC